MSRVAVCSCGKRQHVPTAEAVWMLFGYQYRGEGSDYAESTCRHCRYHRIAHQAEQADRERLAVWKGVEAGLLDASELDTIEERLHELRVYVRPRSSSWYPRAWTTRLDCPGFEAIGPQETDWFVCGHDGFE